VTRKITIIFCAVGLLSISAANALPNKAWKDWFGHFEGSYVLAQGNFGDVVEDDFSFSGGATYYPESWPVGIDITLSWSDLDFEPSVLRAINDQLEPGTGELTGGGVEIWSLVPSVVWSSRGGSSVGFNVSAGAGLYDLKGTLTNTGLIYYPPVCDPWFWWCVPGGYGPGTVVRGSQSTTELGYNVGLGLTFKLSGGSEAFFEAKYHKIETDPVSTEYLPLSVGVRW
jgi:hypothetical protein